MPAARPGLSPGAYRRLTLLAALGLAIIIVTGALVRLTGSGLGCPDWPECNEQRFVDVSSSHGAIEQVNRLFTGLVAVAVILAVLGSLVRVPRRRDLTWLSAGLVAGVIGQIVLGGITVLTDLHPVAVQSHFVLSIVILTDALVLHRRAGEDPGPYRPTVAAPLRAHAMAGCALLGLAILTGTVVTGSGPHGGDEEARRFGFEISSVARVHSLTVIAAAAVLLWLAYRVRHGPAWSVLGDRLTALLVAVVLQGTVGYAQYFNDVPVLLVALHIVGVVVVWWLACDFAFATRSAVGASLQVTTVTTVTAATTAAATPAGAAVQSQREGSGTVPGRPSPPNQ